MKNISFDISEKLEIKILDKIANLSREMFEYRIRLDFLGQDIARTVCSDILQDLIQYYETNR